MLCRYKIIYVGSSDSLTTCIKYYEPVWLVYNDHGKIHNSKLKANNT